MACEIEPGFDPVEVRYQAAGLMMDITIIGYYEGKPYTLTYIDWIGEFNRTLTFEDPGTAHLTITNKDGGNIVGAIYEDGRKINYQVDPVFVEITRAIE